MPGAIGTFGRTDPGKLDAALRKLQALPGTEAARHEVTAERALGSVSRSRGPPATSYARDERTALLVQGSLFREAPAPRRVEAAELLEAAGSGRLLRALADCDGGCAVVAVDLPSGRVTVVADRVGAQPIYFGSRGGVFAFGPEAKAVLTLLGGEPRFSREGLFGFLSVGYNLGGRTLFEGVSYLEPGTLLTHDPRTGETEVKRYFSLRYEVDPRLEKRRVAEEALFDGIVRGHRVLLADQPEHEILLSGGADSRGIMGTLRHLGAPPRHAVAWGCSQDIPWSDAYVAARVARTCDVPLRFLPYTAGDFVENASEWAYRSELANDNMGWYGEGLGSLRDFYAAGTGVSFVGDEVWGSAASLTSDAQVVVETKIPPALPRLVAEVLRPELVEEARGAHEASLRAVLAACPEDDIAARRDCFYVAGRIARFIMSLGYYKEHATELRRPFFTRAVLDVVTRLPDRFRRHKNLYRSTLARFFPRLMIYPDNLVSSLPDWSYDLRRDPELSAFVKSLLDHRELERGPLAGLVERVPFERLRDRYFAAPVAPLARRVSPWSVARRVAMFESSLVIRASSTLNAVRRRPRDTLEPEEFDVLRRIALLVLLQRRLGDLSSC